MNPQPVSDTTPKIRKLPILAELVKFIKPYRARTTIAAFALVFTAITNLILVQGIRLIIDNGFIAQSSTALDQGILGIMILVLLMVAGTFVRFYMVSWLGERVSADIRTAVFNHVVGLHPHYFETNRSGEIMSRLTTDTSLLQNIIGSSASMALRSALLFVGGIIMLFATNFYLSLMVIVCVPMVLLPITLFGRRVRNLSRKSQDSIADLGTHAGEIIQHIKTVQSYTREDMEKASFQRWVESAFQIAQRRVKQRAVLIAVVMLLVFSAIAAMLWAGGNQVLNGNMSPGELSAFVIYAVMVAMSVATISEVYGELQRAAGATERLMELLHVESTIKSPHQSRFNELAFSTADIRFDQVVFSYPSRPNTLALNEIGFTLSAGKSLALVGPSGAGKSTMFELLQRFYDPASGEISIGGIDIRQLSPEELRSQIGVVSQQPVLFTGDVNYNIRYGNPEATEQEVLAASKAAHAHDFIQHFPEGYNSNLGEQGIRLSGGQKQRIAIARAILKNPAILLLDEATSALDSESEQHVQLAMHDLMKNRTTIIIAHRLSTIMHADRIAVMDVGRITAIGKHQELLKNSELYSRLYHLQFKEQLREQLREQQNPSAEQETDSKIS